MKNIICKFKYLLFMLLAFVSINVIGNNVNALEANPTTFEELSEAVKNSEIDLIKLGADISFDDAGVLVINVDAKDRTLDFNGYTLLNPVDGSRGDGKYSYPINIVYRLEDKNFTFTNSKLTGGLVNKTSSQILIGISHNKKTEDDDPFDKVLHSGLNLMNFNLIDVCSTSLVSVGHDNEGSRYGIYVEGLNVDLSEIFGFGYTFLANLDDIDLKIKSLDIILPDNRNFLYLTNTTDETIKIKDVIDKDSEIIIGSDTFDPEDIIRNVYTGENRIIVKQKEDPIILYSLDDWESFVRNADKPRTFKLANNIDISEIDDAGNHDTIYVAHDLIFDLNGNELILGCGHIRFYVEDNVNVKFIDSSKEGTGKITTSYASDNALEVEVVDDTINGDKEFNLYMDGIDLEGAGTVSQGFIKGWIDVKNLNVYISNVNASNMRSFIVDEYKSLHLKNFTMTNSMYIDEYNNDNTLSQIVDPSQYVFVDNLMQDKNKVVNALNLEDKVLKIKEADGLQPANVIFENQKYGYSSVGEKIIEITNNKNEALSVTKISVDNTDAFTITGSVPVTVDAKGTNSSFTIKPKDGLGAGTYNGVITVEDNKGIKHLSNVSFVVEKSDLSPSVSMENWTYGNTPSEVVVSNAGSGTQTISYKGVGTTVYEKSNVKPTDAGDYKVIVDIAETTNTNSKSVEVTFKINKKIVTVNNVDPGSISYNETFALTPVITLSDSNALFTSTTALKTGSDKYVGTGKKGIVTITLNDDSYKNYCFDENKKTKDVNITFNINPIPVEITSTSDNINLVKGTSLDLTTILNLTPAIENPKYTFTGVDLKTGVTLTDSKIEIGDTAVIGEVSKVNVKFNGLDLNDDTVNEFSESEELSLYIKVVDKETVVISGLNYTSKDYDGNKIVPTGTLSVSDNKVPVNELEVLYEGTGETTYSSDVAPTNVGDYKVTYKVKDTNKKYMGSVSYTFSINKATPEYTVPTITSKVVIGSKLNTVTLPLGFTWNTPTDDLTTAGNVTKKVTYTPSDTDNYKVINDIDVTFYVSDKYTIVTSVDGGNGTVTDGVTLVEGDNVEIKFTPNTGYMIDTVKVNSVDVTNKVKDNTLKYVNVDENKNVVVKYKKIPYTITINKVTGATVTPSESLTVSYGDSQDITIVVDHGYKLNSVKVNDIDVTTSLVDGKLTLTNIIEDKNVVIDVSKIIYNVTEGNNQKYVITKDDKVVFKIEGPFELLDKVYIDDKVIDKTNYKAEKGSTIITFLKEYIDALKVGKHNLKVTYTDGGEAIAQFNVLNVEKPVDNPSTGDNIMLFVGIAAVCVVGIVVGIVCVNKKKK